VGITALLLAGVHLASPPPGIHFDSARDLKELIADHDIHVHSGATGRGTDSNFFVADHPLTFDDTVKVAWRRDCGLTPAWQGIVWVAEIVDPVSGVLIRIDQITGNYRIWGNVIVAGDERVMDRIEELARDQQSQL
jgi:hypothetical protein